MSQTPPLSVEVCDIDGHQKLWNQAPCALMFGNIQWIADTTDTVKFNRLATKKQFPKNIM